MASKGLEIIMGLGKGKKPMPDAGDDDGDEPAESDDSEDTMDACRDVWDAVQASDEDAFCRALKAAIGAYK